MYTKHPYRRDVIGKRQIIASIPQKRGYGLLFKILYTQKYYNNCCWRF
ncbi:MAG: hypothetical protein L6V95_04155 [Candidatus Melainabacteria bacterium]|nr:MAG: hypothetical protein L6V95_04155 [Candidatus Melainabacteria bacterium]